MAGPDFRVEPDPGGETVVPLALTEADIARSGACRLGVPTP